MTFSVLGTDGRGGVGVAVASSSPAVAARCVHLRAGIGGATSQNITDPRLGSALLDRLAAGASAEEALAAVTSAVPGIDYRQLTVLGLDGRSAAFSGNHTLGTHHQRTGVGVVVAGNMLADTVVVDVMVDAFGSGLETNPPLGSPTGGGGLELERRLLASLAAGLQAGGEAGPVHSAGLAVVRTAPWLETDLRVDWSDTPVADLSDLLDLWLPQRDAYVQRALDPATSPSYGVAGDDR
ncbi:DUF1028 domain-containing protein [Nocardioides alkalitolerans]|uniref:DUF1028 domain-containing protein n=1 Tax=Nocardioides alkalitolerans TaxID=281714 RepID=UPI000426419B|nr:DUF1028 domain-containing protein [Nocardioides alkalitolerans]